MTEKQETKTIKDLSIGKLKPFTGHPYRVVDDDEMNRLVESIEEHGVMTPIYVRPIDGGYEVISGHRRIHAAKRAGLDTVPAIEMDMTRDGPTKPTCWHPCWVKISAPSLPATPTASTPTGCSFVGPASPTRKPSRSKKKSRKTSQRPSPLGRSSTFPASRSAAVLRWAPSSSALLSTLS